MKARKGPGIRVDEAAVSDVLGSVLLVGITVVSAAAFGVLLLSFDGPHDQLHVDVELRTLRGPDGLWATGDERLQITHMGGEPLPASSTSLSFVADGTTHTFADMQLELAGTGFSDGSMTLGEVWATDAAATPMNLAQTEGVSTNLVSRSGESRLLASGLVSGGGLVVTAAGGSCTPDTTPPAASFSKTPANLDTRSGSTPVVVTLVATDACNPVNTATAPRLWYRISPGPQPGPTAFTDLGTMSLVPTTTSWTKTIPAPSGGWSLAWGQTLQFYATGLKDTAPAANTLVQTATQTDIVDLVGSATFAQTAIATAGRFEASGPLTAMQGDDGSEARFSEACSNGPPVSGAQLLCGVTASGIGATSPEVGFRSDDQRASVAGVGSHLIVTGFDVPGVPTTATQFVLSLEAQRGSSGNTNPTVQLEYQYGAPTCSGTWVGAGSTFTVSTTSDATTTRVVTTGQPYTVAQMEALCLRVRITAGTRALLVDGLTLTPTYNPTTTTVHDLNLELAWNGLDPAGLNGLFEVEYRVASGESYTVEKWNGASWTGCSGALTSTASATFRCSLTAGELQNGSPTIRMLGTSDSGAATTISMDYARMVVFI